MVRFKSTSRPNMGRLGNTIILVLFGIPFLGAGCGVSYICLRLLVRYHQSQSWVEVPAHILSLDLIEDDSGDSTTYQVVCQYEYERQDHKYVGRRVGLTGGSDNIGSWQQDTYARLRAAQDANKLVTCYVNPERPDDALLVRDLRHGKLAFMMPFSTLFGSIGLLVLCFFGTEWHSARAERKRAALYPDQPWTHNSAWADGVIPTRSLCNRFRMVWAWAIYWNAVSAPVLTVVPTAPNVVIAALLMIYPFAGFAILAYAVYLGRAVRKWGNSFVELETFPGVIGGHLRGTLTIVGDITAVQDLKIELKCTEYESRGESTQVHIPYREVREHAALPVTFGQSEIRVPFDFQIPASCPQTGTAGIVGVRWELTVRAETPGVDLKLKFDMPVFVTSDTDPKLDKPAGVVAAENALVQADSSPEPKRIRVTQVDAMTRILELSCWPGPALFILFAFFFAVFATITGFLAREFMSGEWVVLIFLVPFSIGVLLIPLVFLAMLGKFTVTLSPGELRVRRSWGPLSLTEQTVTPSQIASVQYSQSASSGEKKWYAVKAKLANGTDLKLAGMLPGILAARWVVRQVHSAMGLVESEGLAQMDTERTQA